MTLRMRYDMELEGMLAKLVKMARTTEEAIEESIAALAAGDREKLKYVAASDKEIDNMERDIERNCFKLLLMEQPVATDFREVSAALKMITDLERIGDQACDIAEIGLQVDVNANRNVMPLVKKMAEISKHMLHEGVSAYINKDVELAGSLYEKDDEVDSLFLEIQSVVVAGIKSETENAEQGILMMMIAKYLERIADHAVNVGEWVEYAVTGKHRAHREND